MRYDIYFWHNSSFHRETPAPLREPNAINYVLCVTDNDYRLAKIRMEMSLNVVKSSRIIMKVIFL
jgi:hypothetical protein